MTTKFKKALTSKIDERKREQHAVELLRHKIGDSAEDSHEASTCLNDSSTVRTRGVGGARRIRGGIGGNWGRDLDSSCTMEMNPTQPQSCSSSFASTHGLEVLKALAEELAALIVNSEDCA